MSVKESSVVHQVPLNTFNNGQQDIRSLDLDQASTVRILYVEDDETIAANTKEMLEQQGWHVDSCADADTGLARILSDARYHFVLVDYRLPDLNGLELVKSARTLPHRAHTPIAVISATPVEAEAKDAGANVFLRKPQDIGSIANTIKRFIGERKQ
jgi:two-component system, chemotaxis family, chemotaxis protein CheY